MDLRRLRTFVAIAELGTVSRAALQEGEEQARSRSMTRRKGAVAECYVDFRQRLRSNGA